MLLQDGYEDWFIVIMTASDVVYGWMGCAHENVENVHSTVWKRWECDDIKETK